jgi:hypothetical protein
VEQRIAEAAPLAGGAGAVTGWAALRWLGAAWFDGTERDQTLLGIDVLTGGRWVRQQPGYNQSMESCSPALTGVVDDLRITSPVWATCFAMRHARSLRDAVVVADMAAYNDLASLNEVAELVATIPGARGITRCRAALDLANENTWSPREVDFRLIWELGAGMSRALCNVPLFDRAGNLIGTPDLLDLEAGIVGEYDGALHLQGAQRARDVRREARFRSHGLEYVTMLAGDIPDPSGVTRRIHEARRRALFTPGTERSWTISQPAWWTSTSTVAQRRALTSSQRARFLSFRLRAA